MSRFLLALIALFVSTATLAQQAPVPAPDPGPPVTTMRPSFMVVKNSSFPKRRIGVNYEMVNITADVGNNPGKWPGYGSNSTLGMFTPGGQARNGGAFRVFARRSHFAYDDPIIYPNQQGKSHLHIFFGNTNTSGASTPESIRNTGNSTSGGGIVNRSAYWVPAIIYVCDTPEKIAGTGTPDGVRCDPSRNGEVVDTIDDGLNIYYKGNFGSGEADASAFVGSWVTTHDNQPLPTGFRMIAGDSARTTPQTIPDMVFACSATNPPSDTEYTARMIPGTGLASSGEANVAASMAFYNDCVHNSTHDVATRAFVMRIPFPACLNDARDLDSPTHNTHISYPIQDPAQTVGSGALACPTGFGTSMPGVTYHVKYPYRPLDWPFWRLASDHYSTVWPAGYSMHGDWFNGWKPDIMAEWTFNCDVRALDCHDNVLGPHPQVLNDAGYTTPCTLNVNCVWRVLQQPRFDR